MNIDIDKLLNGTDGWDLTVSIGGSQFVVDMPTNDAGEALQTLLSADAMTEANRPDLEKLIAPLIREASADIKTWKLGQLVGAATAIVVHARQIHAAHSQGICKAVVMAMLPAETRSCWSGPKGMSRTGTKQLPLELAERGQGWFISLTARNRLILDRRRWMVESWEAALAAGQAAGSRESEITRRFIYEVAFASPPAISTRTLYRCARPIPRRRRIRVARSPMAAQQTERRVAVHPDPGCKLPAIGQADHPLPS